MATSPLLLYNISPIAKDPGKMNHFLDVRVILLVALEDYAREAISPSLSTSSNTAFTPCRSSRVYLRTVHHPRAEQNRSTYVGVRRFISVDRIDRALDRSLCHHL